MTRIADIASANTDAGAAALAAALAVEPKPIEDDARFVVLLDGVGSQKVVDLDALRAETADNPRRKRGQYTLRDAESFAAYVLRHGTPLTEVWADLEQRAILAVMDGHAEDVAGFHEHKATLALRVTTAWQAWTRANGNLLPQETFAELIEARQQEVVEPKGADLLTIAQTIKQTKAADFESSKRLSDGQTVLVYREETKTSAGKSGEFEVPETFTLAVAPFEGSDPFKVTARLRTRIEGGRLLIGYVLDRPDEVVEAAFADVLTDVRDLIGGAHPVLMGWPGR